MRLAVLGVLLLTCGVARAQDITPIQTVTIMKTVTTLAEGGATGGNVAASPFGDDSVRSVVKGEGRLTQRIILVLDVSGSMKNENRIGRVMQVVRHVMEQPTDDLEVAVITFTTSFERWVGKPEPKADPPVPVGWARLPSADALSSAQVWVATRASGGTDPRGALKSAIGEARDKVSVVFVTDGDFDGAACVETFREAQQARAKSGLAEAPVLVYGVGTGADKHEHLATIGKEGGVGFWVDKEPAAATVTPRRFR